MMSIFCRSIALVLSLGIAKPSWADDPAPAEIPLKRVALFSSGVGFFEHRAEIDGDRKVDLQFRTEDINDLLKSMVLQDLGGGRISTITYGSKDPIEKTLKTFAIDLTANPTLPDLLKQVRGEKITVEADKPITGTIVGIETRKQQVGKDEVIEVEYLNLLTPEGLRSISLQTVGLIKLTNPALDAEFRQALEILALAHATDKKTVTLQFLGDQKRAVRVGYIQNSPIWKTSYRLVLGEKPFLQGWAIVENSTEEDWKDVDLTLVSGRPISFVMNLYDPLYVDRPEVEPELFASLRPPKYDQDLAAKDKEFADASRDRLNRRMAGRPGIPAADEPAAPADERAGSPMTRSEGTEITQGRIVTEAEKSSGESRWYFGKNAGVQSVAQASDLGQLFQYKIDTPVSLARQRSAMIPIVNEAVEAEKLSIYNPSVHSKHPLHGLRLKNSTSLHLMQGPITVFADGAYAGDAQIQDLPAGSERLISYAVNLDTEVAVETTGKPEELTAVKIVKGVLQAERKYRREQKYVAKNSGKEKTKLLIEYPAQPEWKLTQPEKPAEKTRDMVRFSLDAEPGKPAELLVAEELVQRQDIAILNLDDTLLHVYVSANVVSPNVKEVLQQVVAKRGKIAEVNAKLQQTQQQIATIGTEQNRIRQNMATLDKTSELYRRYVKKFGDQEDEVEKLNEQLATLTEESRLLQVELEKFVNQLTIDL